MVTKDYYSKSSHVFPSLCLSLDIFAWIFTVSSPKNLRLRLVFHLKMASAYIPFDEVLEYCTSDVPGEVFFYFSDQSEEDISDHHESEDDVYEENDIPSSNSGDSNSESDSNGMFFCLFVSATDFTNQFLLCMLHPYFLIPST